MTTYTMQKQGKKKPKYMILDDLEIGAKFQVLKYKMIKTDKAGIDYRIVCKDERGIEHQLKRCTVVRCIE